MLNLPIRRALSVLGFLAVLSAAPALAAEYRLLFVGSEESSGWLGAQQGLVEANHQGEFLGLAFTLEAVAPEAVGGIDDALAVIVAGDAELVRQMSERAPGIAVLNIASDDDALRDACLANALHVIPSRSMMDDAEAQWHEVNPDEAATAQAWHPRFTKYAARDLNSRFLDGQGVAMDDQSWAGWAAVRMVSDTAARHRITDAERMLEHLRTALVFDGQKGTEMNFRDTGQLRQILLLVDGDRILGEAPLLGAADPTNLDSLGRGGCA